MARNRIQRIQRVISLIHPSLICWIILAWITGSANGQTFVDLKKVSDETNGEKILVMHIALGECENCIAGFKSALECVKNQLPSLKMKVVAGVLCEREKELKIFRKNYDWEMAVIRDTGTLRKKLGVPENTRITILNSNGKVLAHISDEDFLSGGQCDRLLQMLKE
jgi:hypothetical protein